MKTSDLIQMLAGDLTPVSIAKTRTDLIIGLSCGAAVSLLVILLVLGVQPGLLSIPHGMPFIMKVAYCLSLATIATTMLLPALRPGSTVPARLRRLASAAAALAFIGLAQNAIATSGEHQHLWLGSSWRQCSLRILWLSVPIFVGVCWAIRRQAPVHLTATGALAGTVSGGIAASLYALTCADNGAYVLIWYSIGIFSATGVGALVGGWVLRW